MSKTEKIKRMMVWVWLKVGVMVIGSQFSGESVILSAGHPFELSDIVITPSNPTLQPGQSLVFTAEGRDQSGQSVAIQDPHWEGDGVCGSIAPVAGSVPPQCVYTASGEGSGYILCYEGPPPQGGINGSTDIAVKAGSSYLARIEVSPSHVSLQVGQQQQFTASGYDQNGNVYQVNPIWSSDGGTVNQDGNYTATVPGDFTVSASNQSQTITGSAGVHVEPSSYLARIEVSPNHVSLQVGQQQQFTASGYDQNGNVYQVNPIWSSDGGTVNQDGNYTATVPGDFTVSASNQSQTITGSAGVHVEPVTGIGIDSEIPSGVKLFQNFPNPFHSKTSIPFFISSDQTVCLAVYDVAGKEIAIMINQNFPAGLHRVEFNPRDIASGIYFFRMTTETFSDSRKMLLIR